MSAENVELVRGAYEQFNSGQEAPLSALDEAVEWHTAADLPNSDVHRGHAGVRALIDDWVGSFEQFTADVEEYIDRGDFVVVSLVLRGRMAGGDEVSLPETHVWRVRDGRVIEVREYRTLDAALEALA
jgi:ketosteroid isomerase-like protein